MSQWMQCNWIQQSPTWADSVCSIQPDTHDGVDSDDIRRRVKAEEKAFKSARQRLREVIAQAYDPNPGPVAQEVKALAAPYVERLESGNLRVDYKALESRNKAVLAELLAFQDALRTEFNSRMAIANDDEDVMILTALWN